jgi:hypothetical protein
VGSGGGESWSFVSHDRAECSKVTTHFWVPWTTVDSSDLGRGILRTPLWFGEIVVLFLLIFEHVRDWTWDFLQLPRRIEEVHHVILVSDLIRQAAGPGLDLVQLVVLLVVTRFADVDLLILGKVSRSALVVSCHKHDKAAVDYLINTVIAVLACLDHLVFEEMSVKSMHSLLWTVVPARVHPLPAICVLPCAVDLSHDRLGEIIYVLDVYPVADFP